MKKCTLGIMVFLVCVILTMGLSAAQDLIYVVERGSGELSVVHEDGQITVLASGLGDPLDVEILPNGNLLVSERSTLFLTEISPGGSKIQVYPGFSPNDIFIDDDGTIYVTSHLSGIWKKGPLDSNFSQFSNVPGDLTDMVRLGDYFYVTNVHCAIALYSNSLFRIDQDTGDWFHILPGFSAPLGLAVIGEDLLVAEIGADQIRRVTNVAPGPPSPTVSLFAGNLPKASSFTVDDEGNFILSHQKTPGRISKIDADGNVTIFIETSFLSNPRGLVFSSGVIEVTIDIKPGSDPNSINLSSAGVIPVAILSTSDFIAPEEVDPATVSLAGAAIKVVGKSGKYLSHAEDVDGDGLLDLVCQVLITEEWAIELGETSAVLTAKTYDDQSIRGEDAIRIVPDK